ncbi:MAG TPA: alpha/beta hydrolase fold domain-containing protein [Ferruginibacter sp.]|nr:alpha/beta hydrolase fold domain-containing protein [Ferruginibacter sp.]
MKQLLLLLLLPAATALSAQNPGCDGTRYKLPVFSTVTKTTVKYCTAPSYFSNQTVDLHVDIYQPAGDTISMRPALVLAHGGSFIFGNKSDMQQVCEVFAAKGYVALSIQYRLYPVIPLGYPDSTAIMDAAMKAVSDMKAAVRFLRQDAAGANTFRIDPNHIFIGGYSAGAVTALHAGYLDNNDNIPGFIQSRINANGGLEGNSGDAANHAFSSASGAVVNMSGGLYRREWIGPQSLPLVSIHGTADDVVNYNSGLAADIAYLEGSHLLHARAEEVGVWNDLTTVVGAGHTDLYTSATYAAPLYAFFDKAANLLESLTCTASGTSESAGRQAVDWNVYPNPVAFDGFRLDLPESLDRVDVSVYSMSGQQMYAEQGVEAGRLLPVHAWPQGMYLIRVQSQEHPEWLFPARLLLKQ